ncbi:MAG: chemotaxis protein CheA [Deltaproteobacteria bacterium]|nr:chemotaxis protein CheA [Deltaproteobacteria bacterium]
MSSLEFLNEYIEEVREHLQELEESLLTLERDSLQKKEIDRIFRAAHSIKGASAYMGFEHLAGLTHELESFMSNVQSGDLAITPEVITTLLSCVDGISGALKHLQEHGCEPELPPHLLEGLRSLRSWESEENTEEIQTMAPAMDAEADGTDDIPIEPLLPPERSVEATGEELPIEWELEETEPVIARTSDGAEEAIVEEDQELFSIFLSSFQEQYARLQNLCAKFQDTVLSEADVQAVVDIIAKLIASSQYMDYEVVVGYLQELEADVRRVSAAGTESGNHCIELIEGSAHLFEQILPGLVLSRAAHPSHDPLGIQGMGEAIQEEDTELLGIFTDSFQQHMEEILQIAGEAKGPFMDLLQMERIREILKKLLSSSQYMGYDPVVDVLTEWDEALAEAQNKGLVRSAQIVDAFNHFSGPLKKLLPGLQLMRPQASPHPADPSASLDAQPQASRNTPQDPVTSVEGSGESAPVNGASAPCNMGSAENVQMSSEDPSSSVLTTRKEQNAGSTEETHTSATLRVDAQKVDQLLNQVGELVVTRSEFIQTSTSFREILRELAAQGKLSKQELRRLRHLSFRLNESTLSLGRVANDLQNSIMRVRMLPISFLFQRFPRVVRDQALKLGKKVNLIVEGADTEIDKRVLEQMHDPLVQFLRNAIAHGIETPTERKAAGKEEVGAIRLGAYHEGDYVAIEIEDDGRGIDTRKLRESLQKRKGLSPEQLDRLTEREMMSAIFLPGISTHERVDGSAGRGVGLDVVKENLERMSGSIEVESEAGRGTRFTIRIPLTVAIIRALMVQGAEQIFAVPLTSVSEILRFEREKVHTIESFQVITLRGKTIPLVPLGQLLGIAPGNTEDMHRFIVIVSTSFREVGLVVDGLMGEREIVIKPIEDSTYDYEGFSGATILGDGAVSLILDVSALLRMMKQSQGVPQMNREGMSVNQESLRLH